MSNANESGIRDLRDAFDAARAKAKAEPTQDNRDAAKAAWAALVAASPTPKGWGGGFASRAGQRQAAECRAMTAAALARARRR